MIYKKPILFFLLLFPSSIAFSQIDLKLLRGEWLAHKIINLKDSSEIGGKYAEKGKYVKFDFTKKNVLKVTTSPFDKALEMVYSTRNNKYELELPKAFGVVLPESKYKIVVLTDKVLKLQATDFDNNHIEYSFTRVLANENQPTQIEYEPILIKKVVYEIKAEGYLHEYNFKQNTHNYQHPIYRKGYYLGSDISRIVQYPKDFKKRTKSKDLTLKVLINEKGKVTRVEKLNGVDPMIDNSVIEFMEKTKWKPVSINNKSQKVEVLFHFNFLLDYGKML